MYEVILQRQPKRYYARCDKSTAKRLAACFEALEQDPFGPGTTAGTVADSRTSRG